MRFGVAGTGFWARVTHATALSGHPTAELAAVWGRDGGKAAALGEEFDVPGHTDYDAFLADVDAVAFSLPPDVQAPLAVRAAEAGKHVLLEKPIALTVDDADRLVAATESTGVASIVFFTRRFEPATDSWLAQASRTRLVGGGATWFGALAGSPFDTPWRREHGALWDLGPHALSLLVPTLGRVVAVQAGGGFGDTVHLVLHHHSGAASTVTLSQTVAQLTVGEEFFVHGDAGRIVLLPDGERPPIAAYQRAVDDLLAAATTGGSHELDVRFGRDVVLVLDAARRALASGCREPVASAGTTDAQVPSKS